MNSLEKGVHPFENRQGILASIFFNVAFKPPLISLSYSLAEKEKSRPSNNIPPESSKGVESSFKYQDLNRS